MSGEENPGRLSFRRGVQTLPHRAPGVRGGGGRSVPPKGSRSSPSQQRLAPLYILGFPFRFL